MLIAGLLTGCSADTECRQKADIYLGVTFVGDSLRLTADSTDYEHVQFTSVTGMQITGVGRDSILYDASANMSKAQLPLRPDSLITAYQLIYNGQSDTLYIVHDNQYNFISLACGCFVFHTINDSASYHTHHFIDSVHVLNTQVTSAKEDHLRIYFHKN